MKRVREPFSPIAIPAAVWLGPSTSGELYITQRAPVFWQDVSSKFDHLPALRRRHNYRIASITSASTMDSIDRYEESCGKLVFDPSKRTRELISECSKASQPTCSITRSTLERWKIVVPELVCVGPASLPEAQPLRSENKYEDACHDLVLNPLKGQPHYSLCSKASRSSCRVAQKRVLEKGGSIVGLECVGPEN